MLWPGTQELHEGACLRWTKALRQQHPRQAEATAEGVDVLHKGRRVLPSIDEAKIVADSPGHLGAEAEALGCGIRPSGDQTRPDAIERGVEFYRRKLACVVQQIVLPACAFRIDAAHVAFMAPLGAAEQHLRCSIRALEGSTGLPVGGILRRQGEVDVIDVGQASEVHDGGSLVQARGKSIETARSYISGLCQDL